ncbi:hypothetical protein [Glaciihabitans sp. UYNi722]|uniref:hypothetical protein n=1 Tax=Glaciihabitans sp. UYNi722 TaxID=3156344 RepID=UPI00339592BF
MSYTMLYDSSIWHPIPRDFPTDEWASAEAWADGFVALFEVDLGPLASDGKAALREFAFSAIADRQPDVAESLVFCPRVLPVLGIVNVMFLQAAQDDEVDLTALAASDPRAQLEPTVEPFETTDLGVGARGAVVIDSADDLSAAGAFTYAFQRHDQVVYVAATADRVTEATLMLTFVDDLVRGISVEAL